MAESSPDMAKVPACLSQCQDASATRRVPHSNLGPAVILDMHRPPTPDYLCVVEQWTEMSMAQKPLSASCPGALEPPDVAVGDSVMVRAHMQPGWPADAGTPGPEGSAWDTVDMRTGPSQSLNPSTTDTQQNPDLPAVASLRSHEDVVGDAWGTAVPRGARKCPGMASTREDESKLAMELWGCEAAEPEAGVSPTAKAQVAGEAKAALALAPAPDIPVPDPSLMIVLCSVLIPVFLMFYSMLSVFLKKT